MKVREPILLFTQEKKNRRILTNIVFHSVDVSIQLLQDGSQFGFSCHVLEARERHHSEAPAVGVHALEPQLTPILKDLLEHGVQYLGVVPVR